MDQLSVTQLQAWLADTARQSPVLLDVREPWEFEVCSIPGAVSLPLAQLPARLEALDADAETVVVCHHGMRSLQAALLLERAGFRRVLNLQGGVDAWARTVDLAMATY